MLHVLTRDMNILYTIFVICPNILDFPWIEINKSGGLAEDVEQSGSEIREWPRPLDR